MFTPARAFTAAAFVVESVLVHYQLVRWERSISALALRVRFFGWKKAESACHGSEAPTLPFWGKRVRPAVTAHINIGQRTSKP